MIDVLPFPAADGESGYFVFGRDLPTEIWDNDRDFWCAYQANYIKTLSELPQMCNLEDICPIRASSPGSAYNSESAARYILWVPKDILDPFLLPQFNDWGEIHP